MNTSSQIQENIKHYYGKILNSNKDLQTSACCSTEALPDYLKTILKTIQPEILEKFYGCGSPIPPALEGTTVLDLGCGTGRDAYILSKLVGPQGHVIGVDMSQDQLAVATHHIKTQMECFGYSTPNIIFKQGYIEDLKNLDIKDNSIDVVTSNCVINLSPDKVSVFREIFRVLKPGGELYFSDVFSDRRIPQSLQEDPVLMGECLSGSLYTEDFRRLLGDLGCLDYRTIHIQPLSLNNETIIKKIGMTRFYAMTIRAFKLSTLEDRCEDYGQIATYLGTLSEYPHQFILDDHHIFSTGKPLLICGNTASMLQDTRFIQHFNVSGNRTTHFGTFSSPAIIPITNTPAGCC